MTDYVYRGVMKYRYLRVQAWERRWVVGYL